MAQRFIASLFILGLLVVNDAEAFSRDNRTLEREAFGWSLVVEKNAVLVDLRDRDAFDRGHIAGAINIPLTDIVADGIGSSRSTKQFYVMYADEGFSVSAVDALLNKYGYTNAFYAGSYEAMMDVDPLARVLD